MGRWNQPRVRQKNNEWKAVGVHAEILPEAGTTKTFVSLRIRQRGAHRKGIKGPSSIISLSL